MRPVAGRRKFDAREIWYASCNAGPDPREPQAGATMHVEVEHREVQHEFVAIADGHPSYLRYVRGDGPELDLVSTFVHRQVRGKGVGEKLVRAALDYARQESLRVIPTCWFVETVLKRHPEYRDLVVRG